VDRGGQRLGAGFSLSAGACCLDLTQTEFRHRGSVQGVVDFHWTALTMGILPDESLDAFFAFLAIFGL
jgi:hypothetical protein